MKMLRCLALLTAAILVPLLAGSADKPGTKSAGTEHRVPYRLSETLHMIVRAKINGKGPFNFIVDTGAPAMFVTKHVANEVGVDNADDGWATFEVMEIEGGAKTNGAKARVEDIFQIRGMNAWGLPGVRLDGVLGYNILARYRIAFDLSKPSMKWTELDFEPPLPMPLGGRGKSAPPELEMIGNIMQGFGSVLGRGPAPVPSARGFFGLELAPDGDSVQIKSVLPGAPADTAGIKAGDTVLEFAGKNVESNADLLKIAGTIGADERVQIVLERGSEKIELSLKTGKGL